MKSGTINVVFVAISYSAYGCEYTSILIMYLDIHQQHLANINIWDSRNYRVLNATFASQNPKDLNTLQYKHKNS